MRKLGKRWAKKVWDQLTGADGTTIMVDIIIDLEIKLFWMADRDIFDDLKIFFADRKIEIFLPISR